MSACGTFVTDFAQPSLLSHRGRHSEVVEDDSDYDDVQSDSGSDGFYSDGEELAEYWDPYCA